MPLDTSAAQAILAAARANPDVIWQMGMPLNRNGTLNTQAHLANQYIDYANRGYGAAPPDWNTFLQRANQGWTVTDAFNGRQAGDQFAYQNYYPTGPQTDTAVMPQAPMELLGTNLGRRGCQWGREPLRRRLSVGPGIVLSSVFAVGPRRPPPLTLTPPPPAANPYCSVVKIRSIRACSVRLRGNGLGAPWRAGQFSNFSGSFFPAFGVQGVQNYVYPQQPGGTVTRTPGTGLPTITTGTGAGTGTTRSPDQQQSLSSSTSHTPRSFVDWTQGGIQMPYRNQFEQYTQSLAMAQPWNPSFRYTQGSFNNPIGLRNFQQNPFQNQYQGPQTMGRIGLSNGLLGGMTNFVGDTPRKGQWEMKFPHDGRMAKRLKWDSRRNCRRLPDRSRRRSKPPRAAQMLMQGGMADRCGLSVAPIHRKRLEKAFEAAQMPTGKACRRPSADGRCSAKQLKMQGDQRQR